MDILAGILIGNGLAGTLIFGLYKQCKNVESEKSARNYVRQGSLKVETILKKRI